MKHSQGPSNSLISGSGGNVDNLVDKPFIDNFPHCNFLPADMLPDKINKIPTTTKNQTVWGTIIMSSWGPQNGSGGNVW